jgi:hypothetical protein
MGSINILNNDNNKKELLSRYSNKKLSSISYPKIETRQNIITTTTTTNNNNYSQISKINIVHKSNIVPSNNITNEKSRNLFLKQNLTDITTDNLKTNYDLLTEKNIKKQIEFNNNLFKTSNDNFNTKNNKNNTINKINNNDPLNSEEKTRNSVSYLTPIRTHNNIFSTFTTTYTNDILNSSDKQINNQINKKYSSQMSTPKTYKILYAVKSKEGTKKGKNKRINQDNYTINENIFKINNFSLFSVFDGHGKI